jgi:aspartate racemase
VALKRSRSNDWYEKMSVRYITVEATYGTRVTMEGNVYAKIFQRYGLELCVPDGPTRTRIDEIIWEELVHGLLLPGSKAAYCEAIHLLRETGCDCVILGCTEIPLLIQACDSELPLLDSNRLLAEAAVDVSTGGTKFRTYGAPQSARCD